MEKIMQQNEKSVKISSLWGYKDIYNTWDDVNEATGGIVAVITYMVLFANDQVYNHIVELTSEIKKDENKKIYRHEIKKMCKEMEKEIEKYNHSLYSSIKSNINAYADVTQSLEDDILPKIQTYIFTLSQVLLNHGVQGEINKLASTASTINMLAQLGTTGIKEFMSQLRKIVPIAHNPLQYLDLSRIEYLSEQLSNNLVGRDVRINLNEEPTVEKAFMAIVYRIHNPNVMNKAFATAEENSVDTEKI